MSEATESPRLQEARQQLEKARERLHATKRWQIFKRTAAEDEWRGKLTWVTHLEMLERRSNERDAAEREMIRWVERLLEFEQHGGADPEIAEMTVEEIAVKLLILGRRGN